MSDGGGQALIHCGFLVGVFPLAAPWWLHVTLLFVICYNLIANGGCSDVFLDTQFDLVKLRILDLTAYCLGCAIRRPWPTRFLFFVNYFKSIIVISLLPLRQVLQLQPKPLWPGTSKSWDSSQPSRPQLPR